MVPCCYDLTLYPLEIIRAESDLGECCVGVSVETVRRWVSVSSLRPRSPRNLARSQREAGDYEEGNVGRP